MPGLMPLKKRVALATSESLIEDPIQGIMISKKMEQKIACNKKYDIISKVDLWWLQQ
jgi:hypothetical protein